MPVLKIEALDEEPLDDATTDCTGGQVSHARRNLLGASQWAALRNVMLHSNGPGGTRRGSDRVGTDSAGSDSGITIRQKIRHSDAASIRAASSSSSGSLQAWA
jgi:hypothetical protein